MQFTMGRYAFLISGVALLVVLWSLQQWRLQQVRSELQKRPVDLNRANVLLQDHYANAPFAMQKNPLLAFSKAAAK
jgi:hypothetical protein